MILKDNNEYYIEVNDILNNSEFTEPELTDVFGEKIDEHLKNISAKTYRVLYSAYSGWNIDQQKLELQEIINGSDTKKQVMLEAIVEYVRGAVYSGLDLQVYLGKKGYSQEVIDILRQGGLWYVAEIQARDDLKAV
jgi:hypothetical protein